MPVLKCIVNLQLVFRYFLSTIKNFIFFLFFKKIKLKKEQTLYSLLDLLYQFFIVSIMISSLCSSWYCLNSCSSTQSFSTAPFSWLPPRSEYCPSQSSCSPSIQSALGCVPPLQPQDQATFLKEVALSMEFLTLSQTSVLWPRVAGDGGTSPTFSWAISWTRNGLLQGSMFQVANASAACCYSSPHLTNLWDRVGEKSDVWT